MADFISLALGSSSNASLQLVPYTPGQNDPHIYFDVVNYTGFYIQPTERVSVLIVPEDDPLTDVEASGYLESTTVNSNPNQGIYIYRYSNTTGATVNMTQFHRFKISSTSWENIKYRLYWLQEFDGAVIFDSVSGVYSFPHNIQPQEVRLSAELINDNQRIRYSLYFSEVNNADSTDYTTEEPYELNISYKYGTGTITGYFGGTEISFADSGSYTEFEAGNASGGIIFDLPFYDQRTTWNNVPAQYDLRINYNSADPSSDLGSIALTIPLNHQQWADNELINMDTWASTKFDPLKLKKISNDIFIERGVIDRKRMSIGVSDIAIRQNSYKKKGTYVSHYYTSDIPIYTFSLKADEFIPSYPNLDPYNVVQYFIQFNNTEWLRISPINRSNEIDSVGDIVPKMYVFDSNTGIGSDSVHFLNYQVPVITFRVKITFDMSSVEDAFFIPPEIKDYDCIIFDKNQLLEI
jgi:hypothetical protein